MRIIFDIDTPQQVSFGGKPYGNGPGKMGYRSSQVDGLIVESPSANHPDLPEGMFGHHEEAIYISGDSRYIIRALEDALLQLHDMDDMWKETLGDQRPTNCPDGCAGIEDFNGMHATTCPKHVNYAHFKSQDGDGVVSL